MIGIFDSGYGGLNIFKDIEKKLPYYDYIYLGDNARVPYGDGSQELIYEYSKEAVEYLIFRGCKLIIFACNTASAIALKRLQQEYLLNRELGISILGVIRPLVEAVSELKNNLRVGIIATVSTVNSKAYINEFLSINNTIKVFQQACPLLVPLIEESKDNKKEIEIALNEYIEPLKKDNLDVMILGCTHYGWLQDMVENICGQKIKVLCSGEIVAGKLAYYITRHPEHNIFSKERKRIFLTTGDSNKFNKAAQKFLGQKIKSKKIKLK